MSTDKFKFNPLKNSGFDMVRDLSLYATIAYVDSQIAGENHWDWAADVLTPHIANSGINLGSGNLTTTGIGTFGTVKATGSGLIWSDGTTGTTPTSGAGTRLMWIPAKGAFRAGYVNGEQWDNVNIGSYSVALGYNTIANGNYSVAMGYNTIANGNYSVAMGRDTIASGTANVAMGYNAIASGIISTAMGRDTIASANYSVALGDGTIVSEASTVGLGKKVYVMDTSSLDAEKITNGTFTGNANGWTLGTGWEYIDNAVQKNADGTGTLSQTSADMVTPLVAGEMYKLSYIISSWTIGTVTPSIAGVTLKTAGANGAYTEVFRATSSSDLVFTPTNTSRFYIDTISLKKITGGDLFVAGALGAGAITGTTGVFSGDVTGANLNISNWNTAYGWGDHALGGYLKADGTVPLTADWAMGAYSLTGGVNATFSGTVQAEHLYSTDDAVIEDKLTAEQVWANTFRPKAGNAVAINGQGTDSEFDLIGLNGTNQFRAYTSKTSATSQLIGTGQLNFTSTARTHFNATEFRFNNNIWVNIDNKALWFGATASDLMISSDGTNGVITTAANLNITTPLLNVTGAALISSTLGVTGAVTSSQFKLSALNTAPANATDTGTLGEIRIVDGFIYVAVAENSWKRCVLSAW